ncbi:YciE/YciF ferroxidase family protein [Sphingomonas bisphenolicum]|jgi:ferritin-like metal-binding protein YciE|uniref:YciE/YciF family protein n=1 Tax=Sphingomonas bisphenolicum TaxID=296544 RepID=A0ABN5WEB2_9SPHN|nr:ferritin-like domain-containing protein [Sphingomonas bisphenolicum]BBF70679.1 YciE/YciF family protein [Sphingomonas bisphenolicum]
MNEDTVRHMFIVGLRDAHAVEHQALGIMDRQIEHLAQYAEVEARLRIHRGETERQIERLESILDNFGESPSALKDAALKLGGSVAALSHALAPDEIIKNSLANYAFENYEAAAYKALIAMAKTGGFEAAIPKLEESLREELAMVAFLDETLPLIVEKFLALRSEGEQASH